MSVNIEIGAQLAMVVAPLTAITTTAVTPATSKTSTDTLAKLYDALLMPDTMEYPKNDKEKLDCLARLINLLATYRPDVNAIRRPGDYRNLLYYAFLTGNQYIVYELTRRGAILFPQAKKILDQINNQNKEKHDKIINKGYETADTFLANYVNQREQVRNEFENAFKENNKKLELFTKELEENAAFIKKYSEEFVTLSRKAKTEIAASIEDKKVINQVFIDILCLSLENDSTFSLMIGQILTKSFTNPIFRAEDALSIILHYFHNAEVRKKLLQEKFRALPNSIKQSIEELVKKSASNTQKILNNLKKNLKKHYPVLFEKLCLYGPYKIPFNLENHFYFMVANKCSELAKATESYKSDLKEMLKQGIQRLMKKTCTIFELTQEQVLPSAKKRVVFYEKKLSPGFASAEYFTGRMTQMSLLCEIDLEMCELFKAEETFIDFAHQKWLASGKTLPLEECMSEVYTSIDHTVVLAEQRKQQKKLEQQRREASLNQFKLMQDRQEQERQKKNDENKMALDLKNKTEQLWTHIDTFKGKKNEVLLLQILGPNIHKKLSETEVKKLATELGFTFTGVNHVYSFKLHGKVMGTHKSHKGDGRGKLDGNFISDFKEILESFGITTKTVEDRFKIQMLTITN